MVYVLPGHPPRGTYSVPNAPEDVNPPSLANWTAIRGPYGNTACSQVDMGEERPV